MPAEATDLKTRAEWPARGLARNSDDRRGQRRERHVAHREWASRHVAEVLTRTTLQRMQTTDSLTRLEPTAKPPLQGRAPASSLSKSNMSIRQRPRPPSATERTARRGALLIALVGVILAMATVLLSGLAKSSP
jgi:hypothetical protein